MVGMAPSTLSRIIGGKQDASERMLRRMALLLRVSEEYLKGQTDERNEPVGMEQSFFDYNMQNKAVADLLALLATIGLTTQRRLVVGEDEYVQDESEWRKVGADGREETGDEGVLDVAKALKLVERSDQDCDIIYTLRYRGGTVVMTLDEFNRWSRRYIGIMNILLQGDFDTCEDVKLRPLEGAEELAIISNHSRMRAYGR